VELVVVHTVDTVHNFRERQSLIWRYAAVEHFICDEELSFAQIPFRARQQAIEIDGLPSSAWHDALEAKLDHCGVSGHCSIDHATPDFGCVPIKESLRELSRAMACARLLSGGISTLARRLNGMIAFRLQKQCTRSTLAWMRRARHAHERG
jgi:hypothetical protein